MGEGGGEGCLNSNELNYLVFRYLQESGLTHAAFALGYEAGIDKSPIDGHMVPPGTLVKIVQKGLQYIEMEANVDIDPDEDFTLVDSLELITMDVPDLRKIIGERRENQKKENLKKDNPQKKREREKERDKIHAEEYEILHKHERDVEMEECEKELLLFLTHSSSQFCQLTYVFSYSSSYHLLPIGASPMATNTIPSSIVFYCMRSTKFCHTRCSVNQPMTGMARRLNGVRVSNIQRKWCVMLEKETLGKKSDARRVFLTARSSNNEDEENDGTSDSGSIIPGLLPYVVAATGVAALVNPSTFSWVSKDLYAPALGGIMLSIGIKLSLQDFAIAFNRPIPLTIGYLAQYMIKPMLGMVIARVFKIPPMFYAGFILTCCVAGAQLSSYASFLSKGDVALSILLTSTTTITSAIVTPLLTGFLIGSVVPVDAIAMSKSILQVVLIPVGIGLGLNTYAKPVVDVIKPVMPILAMICTSLCIGSPLALNRSQILTRQGFNLLLPILSFHLLAFFFGYWFSKIPFCRQEEDVCRTISLCTGMQSSTLAGLLATQFLGSSQAVPAACSVVAMAIMGLYLASFWGNGYRIRDIPTEQPV